MAEQPDKTSSVHEDKLRLLYHQSWPAVWFSMAASGLLWVALRGHADPTTLNVWLAANILAGGLRILLFHEFKTSVRQGDALQKWERPFFLTLLFPVLLWGVGGVVLASMSPPGHQLVIYFMLITLASGAVSAYYPLRYIVLTVISIELLPMTLYFLAANSGLHTTAAITCALFLASSYRSTRLHVATLDENYQLNKQLRASNAEVSKIAKTDYLTGIMNRRSFVEAAEAQLRYCKRYRLPSSLLVVDLDFFKKINDSYGHMTGDEVLKLAAAAIRRHIRESDICARLGGEEFAVFLPHTDLNGAMVVAEHVRAAIENVRLMVSGEPIAVSASIGVTSGSMALEAMIEAADAALYTAKSEGRNCIRQIAA